MTKMMYFNINYFCTAGRQCIPRSFGEGKMVCVCNETYCDDIDAIMLEPVGSFALYTSSMAGSRFERTVGSFNSFKSNNVFPDGNSDNSLLPSLQPPNDQPGAQQQRK